MGFWRNLGRALRGYDVAEPNRSSGRPRGRGASANQDIGRAGRILADMARAAVQNGSYGERIVHIWENAAIGSGITTRWPDNAHSTAWLKWSEGTDCDAEHLSNLLGLQVLAMRAMVESGEVLIRFLKGDRTPENPVGLELQVLESDHLDWLKTGVFDGAIVIQGVEINDRGRPVAYWLHDRHPGSVWPMQARVPLTSKRVPASEVIHLYRRRRPGQLRGVTWLAPSLGRLTGQSELIDALTMKAKIEACVSLVVNGDGEETVTGDPGRITDAHGTPIETIEPGMILYRRGGGSVDIVNPSSSDGHAALSRTNLEGVAIGAGLTYAQLSGDLTGSNYSSMKAGDGVFRRGCEQVQYATLIPMMVQRIARRFHLQGALLGLWGDAMPDKVAHVPPAHEMIDPLKDTLALIAQVRAGLVPLSDAAASFGYDLPTMIAMIKDINAMLDENGVILDTDPRRVAKSGGAQDPAQLAAVEIAATGAASGTAPAAAA